MFTLLEMSTFTLCSLTRSLTLIPAPHTVYAPPSQLLKFAVLGDGFVGKSAITLRFVRNCKVGKTNSVVCCRVSCVVVVYVVVRVLCGSM